MILTKKKKKNKDEDIKSKMIHRNNVAAHFIRNNVKTYSWHVLRSSRNWRILHSHTYYAETLEDNVRRIKYWPNFDLLPV